MGCVKVLAEAQRLCREPIELAQALIGNRRAQVSVFATTTLVDELSDKVHPAAE